MHSPEFGRHGGGGESNKQKSLNGLAISGLMGRRRRCGDRGVVLSGEW